MSISMKEITKSVTETNNEIAKLKGDTNVSTSSALAEDPGSVVIKDTGWFKTIKNIL